MFNTDFQHGVGQWTIFKIEWIACKVNWTGNCFWQLQVDEKSLKVLTFNISREMKNLQWTTKTPFEGLQKYRNIKIAVYDLCSCSWVVEQTQWSLLIDFSYYCKLWTLMRLLKHSNFARTFPRRTMTNKEKICLHLRWERTCLGPSLLDEHRTSTTPRQRTLFWTALAIPPQFFLCILSSSYVSRV